MKKTVVIKPKKDNTVTIPETSSNKNDDVISDNDHNISQKSIDQPNDFISPETLSVIEARKKILLVLLNKIMTNINLPKLNQLSDFKNIDRDLIIKDINTRTIDDMSKELSYLFSKPNKKDTKKYPLNCLKTFAKQIGMNMSYKKRDINITIDGSTYRRTIYEYSLV
jgi:hypothetical protein